MWILVLIFLLLAGSALATTLHGTVYDIELNELNGIIVSVNSTPEQRYVSKNGIYTFELNPGEYELSAEYAGNCLHNCVMTEHVTIKDEGDFVFDIFIFPELDPEDEELMNEDYDLSEVDASIDEEEHIDWYMAVVIAIALLFALAVYLYYLTKKEQKFIQQEEAIIEAEIDEDIHHKNKHAKHTKNPTHIKHKVVSTGDPDEDLKQVLDVIKKEGGRTTQKELRKHIPLSEAKVSLMVAELEAKGKIEKIKKGRGNIIKLKK